MIFVAVLASETLYGRFRIFRRGEACAHDRRPTHRLWGVPLAVLGGAVRVSTPFLFVSLGECITERSGRINLGLEGTLVMGAMCGYGTSYLTGSPWLGVLAAGLVRRAARRAARRDLRPAARQRHRGRHRADAVRHRPRLLSRQAADRADGAAAAVDRLRLVERRSRRCAPRSRSTCCSCIGVALAPLLVWALRTDALGPDRAHRRRERRCGARHGLFGQLHPAARHHARRLSRRHRRLVPVALLSRQLERRPLERAGHHRGRAGDLRALESDAVPVRRRCCSAAPPRSGRRCSRSASPRAIISSTPRPTS